MKLVWRSTNISKLVYYGTQNSYFSSKYNHFESDYVSNNMEDAISLPRVRRDYYGTYSNGKKENKWFIFVCEEYMSGTDSDYMWEVNYVNDSLCGQAILWIYNDPVMITYFKNNVITDDIYIYSTRRKLLGHLHLKKGKWQAKYICKDKRKYDITSTWFNYDYIYKLLSTENAIKEQSLIWVNEIDNPALFRRME